jgi:hypothetical protein
MRGEGALGLWCNSDVLTLSAALTSALCLSSSCTIASRPYMAAMIRPVAPSCQGAKPEQRSQRRGKAWSPQPPLVSGWVGRSVGWGIIVCWARSHGVGQTQIGRIHSRQHSLPTCSFPRTSFLPSTAVPADSSSSATGVAVRAEQLTAAWRGVQPIYQRAAAGLGCK